ncbi:MAG: 1-deoxy-D-xylulose-5-phosphate synthase [Candidatus Omnitrophica bacterium]|nr:1-deoxy-D-xylulose-5-phosphate synthase [Candidatus Omnitrophota bacterium]
MKKKIKQRNPKAQLLDSIHSPDLLKKVSIQDLPQLAHEMRNVIINTVSLTGGHLATNLGSIELTIALHYLLDSPHDKIVWDVGHQSYPHKILTGRRKKIDTIRQTHGLSGFPNKDESVHDHFTVGHASTSISQALGLAVARDLAGGDETVVAVCGDGSLTGGLCYEALNNVGHMKTRMTVVLNDNEMAISKSTGAMSRYLNKIITAPLYNRLRTEVEKTLKPFPALHRFLRHIEEGLKNLLVPGMVFEELGLRYFGPIDGHDIPLLIETLQNVLQLKEPCILHVITKKGKGYEYAEKASHKYHSAPPFDIITGKERTKKVLHEQDTEMVETISYTEAFSRSLLKLAEKDDRIVAITAAMPEGTGLIQFQEKYPQRFFDVGIAEAHAVTFAGALAQAGFKPVCAIYSTFLQRAYDQLIHDVALQNVGVTFCIDRAGLVGADGPTHHGVFDFSFLRSVPKSVVAAPCDESELYEMLKLGLAYNGVFALRYPKASIPFELNTHVKSFSIGEGEVLVEGNDILILSLGNMIKTALDVVANLKQEHIEATLCNMRFVKPLDHDLILQLVKRIKTVITIEEHVTHGGFGSAVLELLALHGINDVRVKICALPDHFIEQGSREYLTDKYNLSAEKITDTAKIMVKQCRK